jgi:hypothetical protein
VSAARPDSSTGGARSLEVRWIFHGRLESAVAEWLGRYRPRRNHARTPTSLIRLAGLSLKVRARGHLR